MISASAKIAAASNLIKKTSVTNLKANCREPILIALSFSHSKQKISLEFLQVLPSPQSEPYSYIKFIKLKDPGVIDGNLETGTETEVLITVEHTNCKIAGFYLDFESRHFREFIKERSLSNDLMLYTNFIGDRFYLITSGKQLIILDKH